jgi:hypothetical protein
MRVVTGFFAVMSRVFGNLVTQVVRMFARIRTAARTTGIGGYLRIGTAAWTRGIGGYARVGTGGIAWAPRVAVLSRLGEVVRAIIFVLFRLFRPGRRNLANDFIWLGRVRIPDGSHRDIQVITIARGRRLRKGRRNTECKRYSENRPSRGCNVGVTTAHAMSSTPIFPQQWATLCHPATDAL